MKFGENRRPIPLNTFYCLDALHYLLRLRVRLQLGTSVSQPPPYADKMDFPERLHFYNHKNQIFLPKTAPSYFGNIL